VSDWARIRPQVWMLLALGSLALLCGVAILATRHELTAILFSWTGEEEPLGQVKGLSDLAAGYLRPRPISNAGPDVILADVNPLGMNVFLEQEVDPDKRERQVQMISAASFHWLRQEFPWEDIEIAGKGDFVDRRHEPHRSAWEKYDQIVDLAEEYELDLIVRLSNPPAWSRAEGNDVGTYAPPDDLQDFADFVHAVVSRYRGRIGYYQIWNEPNIYPEWGEHPVDPEGYVELLKVGHTSVKAADPNATVICGALAATIDLGPRDMSDFVFLQRMYDAGAEDYFDILAMQGYGLWSGPTDRRMQPRVINYSRPLYIRDIMVQNGDGEKPIWISEMNWNASPSDVDPRYGRVTLQQQARYAVLAYQRAEAEWPWLGVVNFWYFKRADDSWERNGQPEAYFRMVTPDFEPLPAYDAMQEYSAGRPD